MKEIREFLDARDSRDPEELAKMFLRDCSKEDLLPLVVAEFKWSIRMHVRLAELDALAVSRPVRTLEATRAMLGEFAPLLDMPYRVGDGRARRFGEMTVEEHRTRIAMLQANVNGLLRDIRLHEQAVELIVSRCATCLDEIVGERDAA